MNIPILLINLDSSIERMAGISQRLGDLGLTFERISAIRGSDLTPSEKRALHPWRPWRYNRTDAEIGCYMSHVKALETIVSRQLPRAIILEDDAEFSPLFARFADAALKMPNGIEMLKLEGITKAICEPRIVEDRGDYSFVFMQTPTLGSAAYLVTFQGAERVLKKLRLMKNPIDNDMFFYWQTGLFFYDVLPYPAWQDGAISTIGERKRPKPFLMNLFRVPVKRYNRMRKRRANRHFDLMLANTL